MIPPDFAALWLQRDPELTVREIAAHFGAQVRTVRNWQHRLGLPGKRRAHPLPQSVARLRATLAAQQAARRAAIAARRT